jgi:hypothetical protein
MHRVCSLDTRSREHTLIPHSFLLFSSLHGERERERERERTREREQTRARERERERERGREGEREGGK